MPDRVYEIYQPTDHPVGERPAHRPRSRSRRRRAVGCWVGHGSSRLWFKVSAICVVVWLMTGAGYFWPMWVMLGLGIPVLLRRR